MKFVSHASTGGPPTSGYNSRSQRKDLERHKTFIQKLHTEKFTIDDILRILASLPNNSCYPSRAQLFSEMQKWGLSRYENRKSRRRIANVPQVLPNLYSFEDIPARQARGNNRYKVWDDYFFEIVYQLSTPQNLREELHMRRNLGNVVYRQLKMLAVPRLACSIPTRSACLGLTLCANMSMERSDFSVHLQAYRHLTDKATDENNELARSCNLISQYLERNWSSVASISTSQESESPSRHSPEAEIRTPDTEPGVDEGMFLFMDMLSRTGMNMSPGRMFKQNYDTRPIRQRLFIQLDNIPTTLLMWMAGGIEKYSPRTVACVLALLLNRLIKDSNTEMSELGILEDDLV